MAATLRSLYICYLTLDDPLVHTQVVAYLEGLSVRGHTVHLLTFENKLSPERRRLLAMDMERRGITWHSLRYHKRPSLPATAFDVVVGSATAAHLVRRHGLDAIHARNHVPAAMALAVRRMTGCKVIFDLRGLMADEYADAGHWRRGGVPYRLTTWVQRLALQRADGIVMLTEALRRRLSRNLPADVPSRVIPCCVDLSRLNGHETERPLARTALGLGDRPVMVYVGKFTGWYMEREMVDFYKSARRVRPDLLFLVLTQSDPRTIQAEFARCGIPASDYVVTRAEPSEMGRYLAAADFGISFVRPCYLKDLLLPNEGCRVSGCRSAGRLDGGGRPRGASGRRAPGCVDRGVFARSVRGSGKASRQPCAGFRDP